MVCTGNICRSAYGEAVLQARLDDAAPGRVEVASAGTRPNQALRVPDPVLALAAEAGVTGLERHRPAPLTGPMLAAADLVITASQAHMTAALREKPAAVQRTFTLLELAALIRRMDERAGEDWFEAGVGVAAFARTASRHRVLARSQGEPLDVPDPYGGPAEGYAAMRAVMDPALETVAAAVARAARPLPGR